MYVRNVLQTERSFPSVLRLLNTFLLPNPFAPTPPHPHHPHTSLCKPLPLCESETVWWYLSWWLWGFWDACSLWKKCQIPWMVMLKKKKKNTHKKKQQKKTQGLQRIKKMRKKRNKTSVCLLFPSDMFYVRRCLWVIKWKKETSAQIKTGKQSDSYTCKEFLYWATSNKRKKTQKNCHFGKITFCVVWFWC